MMWYRCDGCGEPIPNVGHRYCSQICEDLTNCVVHIVGNGDVEHVCTEHYVADYHDVDGVPTSEECPGADDCPDCQSVLEQIGT
jgi:hypothetical protein